jgi:hypothetical protein
MRGTDVPRSPPRTTVSMLQLASRHRICSVNTFYRKHFVPFALPEELADGCRKALGLAAARGQLLRLGWRSLLIAALCSD